MSMKSVKTIKGVNKLIEDWMNKILTVGTPKEQLTLNSRKESNHKDMRIKTKINLTSILKAPSTQGISKPKFKETR